MRRPARGTRAGVVLLVPLLLAGAGVTLVVVALGRPAHVAARTVVAGDAPIDPAKAADPLDVTAANSPTVVVNLRTGRDLVVVGSVDAPTFSCTIHTSSDAGATWAAVAPPAAPGDPPVPCFSADASYGGDGTLYVSFLSIGPVAGEGTAPQALWVARSVDDGRSFDPPVRVAGALAFGPRIAADPSHNRRLYLTWLQATSTTSWGIRDGSNPIVVARSDDGGATWQPPTPASDPSLRAVGPTVAVDRAGHVVVAYFDVGDDRLDYGGAHLGRGGDPYPGPWTLRAARSDDGGGHWRQAVARGDIVPVQRFLTLLAPSPALALALDGDGGGRVYLAAASGPAGDAGVWLSTSDDGGARFDPPRRVDDARPGAHDLPAVAVAPNGRVDVVYYERSADPAGDPVDVSLRSSPDHGRSFGPPSRLTDRAFDGSIGYGSDRGMPTLGTRLGLVATDRAVLAVWADTRAGNPATMRQDLVRTVASIGGPCCGHTLWRDAWADVLVAVVAALVLGVVGRRRRRRP